MSDYESFVLELKKPGEDILAELTPEQACVWHMATGISTEAGELLDAVKKWTIYQKELDLFNVIEELGDLEFYMAGLRESLGISRDLVLSENIAKLRVRYGVRYSNAAARDRADKK